jgi:hypothetical protein
MIKTIVGVILLLIPFLLLYRFKDKRIGFAYVLSFLLAFHLLVAVVTQLFHVFNYPVIFTINLFVALVVLTKVNFKKIVADLRKIKIDWVLVFIIIILLVQFFSIHYDYTGKATTVVTNYKEVEHMRYPYPYFSDEWSSLALVKYSIASGNLPLVNPLWHNSYFSNFEFTFHSFVSEIILLLNLNPVIHYTLLTIFSGMIVCLLVYFILLSNKVGQLAAGIACLSLPYIVNGANLPGLWTLIPLILGIISMLLGFLFISTDKRKMILFAAFLTLIFYPPLFVFYTPALILYLAFTKIPKEEKIKLIAVYIIVCVVVALLMSVRIYLTNNYSLDNTIAQVVSRLSYPTLTKNAIPDFSMWKVVPVIVLLLSVVGIIKTAKKEKAWLVVPVFIGLFYWWLYSFTLWRYIIENERIVTSTSILLVLLSGFGLHYIIGYFKKIKIARKEKILNVVQVLIFVMFFLLAFSYTQRDNWQELKLYSVAGGVFSPASPANIYLQEEDIKLFNFTEKRFLSAPWKGLVIGTVTGNYPLETKPATITNSVTKFSKFMKADCEEKKEIAKEHEIDYIYSNKFDCGGFEEQGASKEGFYLYKINF